MTEWGAYDNTPPGSKELTDGHDITVRKNISCALLNSHKLQRLADENLQSWIYWQFKGYHDITTQSSVAEGLWFANGTVNTDKVKMLSRTYAQV